MWNASRPIVERWVKRELGAEGVARRAVDEAATGLSVLRRLPQTVTALETAAKSMAVQAPAAEKLRFQWMSFWVGFAAGAAACILRLGLAIAEGIEDGLSILESTGLGIWAAGAAGRMPALAPTVPDYVDAVSIIADPDDAGQRGARELGAHLRARGLPAAIIGLNAGPRIAA